MTVQTLLACVMITGCAMATTQTAHAALAAALPVCAASDVVLLDGLQYNTHFAAHKGVTPLEHAQAALGEAKVASVPFGPFNLSTFAPQKIALEVAVLKPRVLVIHYSAFERYTAAPANVRLGEFLRQLNLEMRSAAPPWLVFYSGSFPDRSATTSAEERARIDATTTMLARLMQAPVAEFSKRAYFTAADPNDVRFTTTRSKRELVEGVKLGLTGCALR